MGRGRRVPWLKASTRRPRRGCRTGLAPVRLENLVSDHQRLPEFVVGAPVMAEAEPALAAVELLLCVDDSLVSGTNLRGRLVELGEALGVHLERCLQLVIVPPGVLHAGHLAL